MVKHPGLWFAAWGPIHDTGLLEQVKGRMTAGERWLLHLHFLEKCLSDPTDQFPDTLLDPDFEEDNGPLLHGTDPEMDLCRMGPKVLY